MKNDGLVKRHMAGIMEYSWTAHCLFLMACSIPLITAIADSVPAGYPPELNDQAFYFFGRVVPLIALAALLVFCQFRMVRGRLSTLDHVVLVGIICLGILASVLHYSNWLLALVPVVLVGLNYGKRVAVALAVSLCSVITIEAYLLDRLPSPEEYLIFVIVLVSTAYLVGGIYGACRELIQLLDRERVTFKNLVDALPLGICVIGEHGVEYRNPNIGEVESRLCSSIVSSGRIPDIGSSSEQEFEDQYYRICSTKFPAANGEGRTVLIIENLSETRRLQDEIRKSSYMASVGEMAAGVAHEIRNPLAVIKGYIQLLSEKAEETRLKDVKQYMYLVLEEIDRLGEIIRKFLNLAKPQATEKVPVSLQRMISDVREFLKTEALRRDIDLSIDVDPDIPELNADPAALKQVVFNLVRNAFDAAGHGGKVKLRAYRESKWAFLEVVDNGPGIPKDLWEKIFMPFYSTAETGTGLGLAISRRIALDHDGVLSVRSKPGNTRFLLQIPLPEACASDCKPEPGSVETPDEQVK